MREVLTVAVSLDGSKIGAKVWPAGSKLPPKMRTPPTRVLFQQLEIASFPDAVAAIEQLATQPDRFLMRSELIAPPTGKPQRRLAASRPTEADGEATLRDAPKRLLLLDVDAKDVEKFPEPHGALDAGYAREVWERFGVLAPELAGVECWWAFTAGAGVKPGVRMRFAVWLAEPVTCEEAKRWANALEERLQFQLVDSQLYVTTQPNYVAPPVCVGFADPIPVRSGVLQGKPCGKLPIPDMPLRHGVMAKKRKAAEGAPIPEGEAKLLPDGAEWWLQQLSPGAFHAPIKAAVGVAMRMGCDPQAVQDRILEAVQERGGSERAAKWARELPALINWTAQQESVRREHELSRSVPHPGCETPAVPLEKAQELLRHAVDDWRRAADEYALQRTLEGIEPSAPRRQINVTVGVGKTEAAIGALERLDHAVFLVPTHRLGDELVQRFTKRGISARVWRGVQATDTDGSPMCLEPELAEAALEAGELKAACGACPSRERCRYQAQARETPRVWIGAHNFLFDEPPRAFSKAQAVVVDEEFWQQGLRGVDAPVVVKFEELAATDLSPLKGDEAQDLGDLRSALAELLAKIEPGGELTREQVAANPLQEPSCTRARKLEWRRKPDASELLKLAPQNAAAMAAALKGRARFNAAIPMLWSVVREMAELPEGERVSGVVRHHPEGVTLAWRKPLHEAWSALPMLLLDGTAQREVVEAMVGPVEYTEIRAELPRSVEIVQVRDKAMPRSFFHRRQKESGEQRDGWRKRNRESLARLLEVEGQLALRAGGSTACVLQKDPMQLLLEEHGETLKQAGVALKNFGAIRGLDEWREVRSLVIVGRTLPRPGEVERIARVLFGLPVASEGVDWPKQLVRLEPRASGLPEAVACPYHPNPKVEAVRRSICDAELEQAVGRARAVWRDPSKPLRVLLVGATPVPGLPPDRLVRWDELVPSKWQLVEARWRCVPLSPSGMAATGVWPSQNAAKLELRRVGVNGVNPLLGIPYKSETPLTRYTYRLPGQRGPRSSQALASPDQNAARAALEALLGPLGVLQEAVQAAQVAEQVAAAAAATSPPPPDPAPKTMPEAVAFLREQGYTPLRVARTLNVTEEKLRRTAVLLRRKAELDTREEAEWLSLLLLRPADQVGDAIADLTLGALARRDAALRGGERERSAA